MPASKFDHIIISRTDSIGDVVLTLPLAGYLKSAFPECQITFMARGYTKPVLQCCEHIDDILVIDNLNVSELADQLKERKAEAIVFAFPEKIAVKAAFNARIPTRIATAGRVHTLRYCNRRVRFSRKKSDLHESQLNFKLLSPLGVNPNVELKDISGLYGLTNLPELSDESRSILGIRSHKVILHPKSKGSAVEWGVNNFSELIKQLDHPDVSIIISGTEVEATMVGEDLPFDQGNVINAMGRWTLAEFIAVIAECDALVAASTGPLHIAAALGKTAVGLYTPQRPMHAGRWGPVGENSTALISDRHPGDNQFLEISAKTVSDLLLSSLSKENASE